MTSIGDQRERERMHLRCPDRVRAPSWFERPQRRSAKLRATLQAVLVMAGLLVGVGGAAAQTATPPAPGGGELAVPVEIRMDIVNGDVSCGPPRARLPAQDPIQLRVENRAERSIWFVAPEFFQAANHIESSGFTLDLVQGGFLVAPASTVRVVLQTPRPGEYYFSCYQPGQVPRPESSGFLIVIPAAR